MVEYKFLDAKNTMAITTRRIVSGKSDILLVSHDEDDGMWDFWTEKMFARIMH